MKSLTALVPALLAASPALAHPGHHGGFSLSELAGHLFEIDHIVFAALAALIAVFAYRTGRRAGERAQEAARNAARKLGERP